MLRVRMGWAAVAGVVLLLVLAPAVFATGDENMASCGNELLTGFTPLLPDCRAYEQVSPPFKAGPKAATVAISANGERVLGQSLGAFAGAQGDHTTEGGFYVFSRSGSGWRPSAIVPADSLFPVAEFEGASPSLERTLWAARTPSQSIQAEDLYLREPDGAMVKIGPVLPPSVTAGPPAGEEHHFYYFRDVTINDASDDLSHVLFSLLGGHSVFWPGDTTTTSRVLEARSLYEYSGVGLTAPVLAGVSDGKTKQGSEELPAGELISNCGTTLGSEAEADTYNAVSADGGTVFFTAVGHSSAVCPGGIRAPEVSELFARVNGFRTVAVSEPPSFLCGCESESSVHEPAEFAGASETGLQAFFTSSQELFPEAKSTNLYEYDFDAASGRKMVRVSTGAVEPEVQGVARVSEDGSHVYFVAKGQLTQGPRGGGCLAELEAGELVEEEAAAEEEAKDEEVVSGAKCRPKKAGDNLYVYESNEANPASPSGRLAFLATLTPADAQDWGTVDNRPVQATSDGGFLVFQSTGDLTEKDESSVTQVFEYDAQSEELVRVSVPKAGYTAPSNLNADTNPSLIDAQTYEDHDSPAGRYSDLAVSGDGGSVVFVSAAALTEAAEPAAEAGADSAYEYHSSVGVGGGIREGGVYLLSDGKDTAQQTENAPRGVILNGVDVSGQDVFFETSDVLVSGDGDSQFDVYDARSGGGFVPSAGVVECVGEGCYGGVSAPPALFGGGGGVVAGSVPAVSPLAGVWPAAGSRPAVVKRRVVWCGRGKRRRRRVCVRAAGRRRGKRAGATGRVSRGGRRGK